MAKKRVAAIVKIQIPAGAATPAPPVGTALGPHGVNIMDFCKMYNAQTESQRGTIVPVEITATPTGYGTETAEAENLKVSILRPMHLNEILTMAQLNTPASDILEYIRQQR